MKKWILPVLIALLLGAIILGCIGYGFYWAFFDIQRFEGQEELSVTDSPTKAYTVTAYRNNGGGTSGYAILCTVTDNATGETTVHSRNDVKVLAPGVGSSYRFELENTGNVALEFTMEMDAWFSHEEYPIPVQVRVTDYREEYLLGSGTEMVDVLRLADVDESGTLAVGHVIPYTLEWEWPFEMDDAYDTMLGNLAMDQDITLTIAIRTTATYTPDDDSDGIPATGDHFQVGLYSVMMVASLAGILLLLLQRGKEETNEAP